MEIHCCYRLIPKGEVVHTKYDTDTHTVAGLPDDWFDVSNLCLPEYSRRNYENCKYEFDKMCETVLLSSDAYALVIENNNIGYYVLQFDGIKRFVRSSISDEDSESACVIPGSENYCSIGFRRTKQLQVRTSSGVYRLVLNKRTGLVHTNDGVLKPEFDLSRLSPLSKKYEGYKEMVAAGCYAVVYIDNKPVMLNKTFDNKLIAQ